MQKPNLTKVVQNHAVIMGNFKHTPAYYRELNYLNGCGYVYGYSDPCGILGYGYSRPTNYTESYIYGCGCGDYNRNGTGCLHDYCEDGVGDNCYSLFGKYGGGIGRGLVFMD